MIGMTDFYTLSGVTIHAWIPWKVDLRISRIETGQECMVGFADASNRRDGFRWERRGEPRHHVDAAWLDTVDIYTVHDGEKVGTGIITVYRKFEAESWPQVRAGQTVWACCVSSIGPDCSHRSA